MEIGKHNRKLVELRRAVQQGTLTPEGLLPIEGPILLEEAARSSIDVVDVFLRSGTAFPESKADNLYEIDADVFKSIQDTEHSQGVIATVRPPQFTIEDILDARPQLVVILGRLQDP